MEPSNEPWRPNLSSQIFPKRTPVDTTAHSTPPSERAPLITPHLEAESRYSDIPRQYSSQGKRSRFSIWMLIILGFAVLVLFVLFLIGSPQ